LDLVALDGGVLVFAEVRARADGDWVGAMGSIGPRKRQILRRSALWYWTRERKNIESYWGVNIVEIRFDAICFQGNQVFHIKGWKTGL
jgi:Holliday junction resolvase-like predicted endonuclease